VPDDQSRYQAHPALGVPEYVNRRHRLEINGRTEVTTVGVFISGLDRINHPWGRSGQLLPDIDQCAGKIPPDRFCIQSAIHPAGHILISAAKRLNRSVAAELP
jgi:hypothetical protein